MQKKLVMAELDACDGKDVNEDSKPRWRKWAAFALLCIKDQWFLIGMCIVIIIASQVQVPLSQQATKQVAVSYTSGLSFEDGLIRTDLAKSPSYSSSLVVHSTPTYYSTIMRNGNIICSFKVNAS